MALYNSTKIYTGYIVDTHVWLQQYARRRKVHIEMLTLCLLRVS